MDLGDLKEYWNREILEELTTRLSLTTRVQLEAKSVLFLPLMNIMPGTTRT